ncbi:inorganic phosphate transporter [Kineococcus indalonis]|uniref:inorganic phosphate transporter n=1 Tax=Kineococcus indalonis TaxID=2696566 RepID=UPI001412DB68|nr:inorganic phosphate transporter [Kineococcus indalonis]NAZ85711.1 inorganic phosphate transporter [Kineococcus indalonis]
MDLVLVLVVVVVVVALGFDFTNGFHDAANSIATSVSTRALTPRVALAMAAVCNLVGAFLGTGVAETIGSGIIDVGGGVQGLHVVLAALVGALAWNLITWRLGLPSSSSHALIGALAGTGIAAGSTVHWSVVLDKVVVPMVVSPVVGFALAYLVMLGVLWAFRRSAPAPTYRRFRLAQTVSAAAMALGHGLQDAQKTMGVIVLALVAGGYHGGAAGDGDLTIPVWVKVAAALAISAGTYAGGWRIMRTLGRRIIALDPARGFAAESVSASVLYVAALGFHAPVSTTQAISAAIMGVGATKRVSAVRWGVARSMLTAWVLTLPAAALIAALVHVVTAPLG